MKLVGIAGRKGSGKTLTCAYLMSEHGFYCKNFADPLKKICKELFLFSNNQLWGSQESKEAMDEYWKISPRNALQTLGTEVFRDYLPTVFPQLEDIWVKRLELELQQMNQDNKTLNELRVCVGDVRFQSEVDFIRRMGGVVIFLDRPTVYQDEHPSEQLDIQYDYKIDNTTTQQDLFTSIDQIMKNIL